MGTLQSFQSYKIYELNYRLFNTSGFGLLENPNKWEKILYSIYYFIMSFIYFFFLSLFFLDAYLVRNDKEKLNLNLCVTILLVVSMAKIWALRKNLKKLSEIRKNFREDFNLTYVGRDENHRKIKEKSAKFMTMFTKLIFMMSVPVAVLWFGIPLTAKERQYCIPFPLFQDKKTPEFEIIYTCHGLLQILFAVNILSNDLTLFGCLIRICDHLDILADNILKIKEIYLVENFEEYIEGYKGIKMKDVKVENSEKVKKEKEWRMMETKKLFRQNIVHHKILLQQFQDIEDTYKGQLFIQITGGALVISVIAYDVIIQSTGFNATVIQRFLYVMTIMMDFLVMCYFGTQVSEKSEAVAEALYDLPWFEMDISNRKICQFMIAKCRKSPRLKAKYAFRINLETYLQLIKTSYNVIAVLKETR